MKFFFSLLTLVLLFVESNMASDTLRIEVSNNGTLGCDFQEALLKIKEQRLKGDNRIVHLQLHGGEYNFSKTTILEGNIYSNIIISPYNEDKVYFTGGVDLTKKVSRVDKNKKYLYKIDVSETQLKKLSGIRPVGFLRPYEASWNEIFINGKPFQLSRWPNKGNVKIGTVTDEGALPWKGNNELRGGVFKYDNTHIDKWKQKDDIWISGYFRHGYADDMVPVKRIDRKAKTIETGLPHYWGYGNGAPWNNYYFLNIVEEIDENGEYAIDIKNNKVFFKSTEPINRVVVSKLDSPFFDLYKISNVTISNIIFEYSRSLALTMTETENVMVRKCIFRNLGSAAISVGLGVKPFDCLVEDSVGVLQRGIIGALQPHLYAQSEVNRKGGYNNGIIDCEFYDLGSGAVSLGGGDRKTLTPGNNFVYGCKFSRTNRIEKSYRPAIHITGVGNKVLKSEISELPSMAILFHGNNHLIESNYIHNVCYEVDDNGAVYYGRNPTECGNVVKDNTFANIGNDYTCCSVYIDDCAGGLLVEGNTFYKAGRFGVLIGGGSDNCIVGNKFIDTECAVHIDNRLENWAKHLLNKGGLFEKRLNAVDAFGHLYLKAYPFLNHYKNISGKPSRNVMINNKMVKVKQVCDNPQWMDYILQD